MQQGISAIQATVKTTQDSYSACLTSWISIGQTSLGIKIT